MSCFPFNFSFSSQIPTTNSDIDLTPSLITPEDNTQSIYYTSNTNNNANFVNSFFNLFSSQKNLNLPITTIPPFPSLTNNSIDTNFNLLEEEEDEEDENDSFLNNEIIDTSKQVNNPFKMIHNKEIKLLDEYEFSNNDGEFIGKINDEITPLNCFNLLFNSIEQDLLISLNERRKLRFEARKNKEGKRGRPIKSNQSLSKLQLENQLYYLNRFKEDFTLSEFRSFLSCLIIMGIVKLPSINMYWNNLSHDNIGMGSYFTCRIKLYKFQEMYRCLTCDIDVIQQKLNNVFKANWKAGKVLSSDESMARATMHDNPHHVHNPTKPEKNGLKEYTTADRSTFISYFKLHKRTNDEPEELILHRKKKDKFIRDTLLPTYSSITAVTDAMDFIDGIHYYIVDKYYGCPELVKEAFERGHTITACCKSNRSSEIFTKFNHIKEYNNYNSVVSDGKVGDHSFKAVTTISDKGKKINFITNKVYNNEYIKLNEQDNLNEIDCSLNGAVVPTIIADYHKGMSYVDQANKSIASVYFPHRIYRWRLAYLVWMLGVTIHNSFIIYNSISSNQLSKQQFVIELSKTISKSNLLDEHKLAKSDKKKCKVCWVLRKKMMNCTHMCTSCGPMCKKCFQYDHDKFLLLKISDRPRKKRKQD